MFVDQSNSSVEKAGILGSVPMRLIPCDNSFRMRAAALRTAIENDIKNGFTPCIVSELGVPQNFDLKLCFVFGFYI